MVIFESKLTKTDVTVIKILDTTILAGIGGDLIIYSRETHKLVKIIPVFEGHEIQGIVFNDRLSKILLHGNRNLKISDLFAEFRITELHSTTLPNWIWSVSFIENDSKIVALCMNDKIYVLSDSLDVVKVIFCEEQCVLYSATLINNTWWDLVAISGTVFSEILLWKPAVNQSGCCSVLHRLIGHKGVIFSVTVNEDLSLLCSTSDDRTAILWDIKYPHSNRKIENAIIGQRTRVNGHTARVFCSKILSSYFITAGEDSLINIWDLNGKLKRTIEAHQGGCIWTIDCDEGGGIIASGGSDCAVTLFPVEAEVAEEKISIPDEVPKRVVILASNNLAIFTETGTLLYYDCKLNNLSKVGAFEDLKSYVIMEVSPCRKIISLAGFQGQIYVYEEAKKVLQLLISHSTISKARIYSFHWLNCYSFLTCESGGQLILWYLKGTIYPVHKFYLPLSKEPWSTSASIFNNLLVVGDRKGSLHVYNFGVSTPVQTIKKAHNYLGVSNICPLNDTEEIFPSQKFQKIVSLGRDSIMKSFELVAGKLVPVTAEKLPHSWLCCLRENLIVGFSGQNFVIWDHHKRRYLLQNFCGGGHRSWDWFKLQENLKFVYIKEKVVNRLDFNWRTVEPTDLTSGIHISEINALKTINIGDSFIIISGGEDTTLRISSFQSNVLVNRCILKSHLSSIRAIELHKIYNESEEKTVNYLLLSAGGRAQIILWKLTISKDNKNAVQLTCKEEHSYYQQSSNSEDTSEVRIMDVKVGEFMGKVFAFCACSDGHIQKFEIVQHDQKYHLEYSGSIFYDLKCILKIATLHICDEYFLITMATDGKLVFWNIRDISQNCQAQISEKIPTNKSGINSFCYKLLDIDQIGTEKQLLFLTGGDDNALVLTLLQFKKQANSIEITKLDQYVDNGMHLSQITGAFISSDLILTCGIDQNIVVSKWFVQKNKLIVKCDGVKNTVVPDVQGMEVIHINNMYHIFIFGKGFQYFINKQFDS